MRSQNQRVRAAFLMWRCGFSLKEIAERIGTSHSYAAQAVGRGLKGEETSRGYLDGPAEFYDYERFGDRSRPRRFLDWRPKKGLRYSYDHQDGGIIYDE